MTAMKCKSTAEEYIFKILIVITDRIVTDSVLLCDTNLTNLLVCKNSNFIQKYHETISSGNLT